MDVIDYLDSSSEIKSVQTCSQSTGTCIRVLHEDLWDKFNKKTTEMIVTKAGRRMFPVIKLGVDGLDPYSMYVIIIEFVQVGDYRWKFVNNEWVQGSKSEAKTPSRFRFYTHPESPNYGSHWLKKEIEFPKVKLTNRNPPEEGQVVLNSLHKYEPRVHIIKSNPGQQKETVCFRLPQTQFIAVTAYQNESITELKIKNNPYAKAFAEKTKKKGVNCDLRHETTTSGFTFLDHVPYHHQTHSSHVQHSGTLSPHHQQQHLQQLQHQPPHFQPPQLQSQHTPQQQYFYSHYQHQNLGGYL